MFDVDLVGPGELFFTLEEKPSGAWQRRGGLYVNHEPREAGASGGFREWGGVAGYDWARLCFLEVWAELRSFDCGCNTY